MNVKNGAEIPVTITENEGIAGFNFRLDYDKNYLTPVAITKGDILADGSFTSNLTEETDGSELDYITAYWNCAYNMTEDGELFVVDFLVNDNVEIGQKLPIQLSYENGGLCDNRLNDVTGITTQGEVEIVNLMDAGTDGDLNGYYIVDVDVYSNGTPVETIPSNGNFDLIIGLNAIYSDLADVLPATMFVATYSANNSLIAYKLQSLNEGIINNGTHTVHIDSCANDIAKIKIFIWDSVNGMMPLSESYQVFNQE